jgi:ArsR family transcriptional regulator, arsenate/arsenite/antimonite-responsive transcriptional repressor / arsenate reductase (thioredoxin)
MNVKQETLRVRAALHAALADPARLAVVDALALGDASPTELQGLLGVPSNLLAHHLKVLEQAGVVERTRSEGDHRRTYIHLVPDALNRLEMPSVVVAPRVVFVCTHNSARSQLAVALWRRHSRVPASSAGTQPAERIHPSALAVAGRNGLRLARVRPRHVARVLAPDDFVVTVCDTAHEELGSRARLHWSVPDPVRVGSDRAFDRVYDELVERVDRLAPHLLPKGRDAS